MRPWVLLAGTLLLAQGGAAQEREEVLATVNGHAITLDYVYSLIETMPLGEQLVIRQSMNRFVDSVIREELLFQWLLATDFESLPGVREQIKSDAVNHLIEREVTNRIDITDEDVRTYYEENLSAIRGDEVRASQIQLEERSQCERLRDTIDSVKAFGAAARAHSIDEDSAARGGDLGLFMNHAGPYGFETELFEMTPGEMRVFDGPGGCHLVMVVTRQLQTSPPIEEVQEQIRALLGRQREIELLTDLLSKAEAGVRVQRYD